MLELLLAYALCPILVALALASLHGGPPAPLRTGRIHRTGARPHRLP